jgi:hypothetical protein
MSASVLESRQTAETAIETMRAVVVRSFDAAPRVAGRSLTSGWLRQGGMAE